ncbi:hypothetical protein [Cytobacillus sp. NCCP-133]|uniref:hypothetical protein n=1 Tax=Cytobacillus sp. NCCP-133 TaxID=766848 RepID=UPI00223195AF|nr:hypothetical protein [Cytobacillus sp. NCCP-133]
MNRLTAHLKILSAKIGHLSAQSAEDLTAKRPGYRPNGQVYRPNADFGDKPSSSKQRNGILPADYWNLPAKICKIPANTHKIPAKQRDLPAQSSFSCLQLQSSISRSAFIGQIFNISVTFSIYRSDF